MVKIWNDTMLINPALTPKMVGVGQKVNGDLNPVLWALTWCCWATPTRHDSKRGWVCSSCRDTIRRGDLDLTAGFEIKGVHALAGYAQASKWVAGWTGVPSDQVIISVEWGRP